MYIKRNIAVPFRNNCGNGKATMRYMCIVELNVAVNNTGNIRVT